MLYRYLHPPLFSHGNTGPPLPTRFLLVPVSCWPRGCKKHPLPPFPRPPFYDTKAATMLLKEFETVLYRKREVSMNRRSFGFRS
eukprot:14671-Hanusia_phi.AAC.1